MARTLSSLARRDNGLLNGTTTTLTIVLVVLLSITLLLAGALLFLRQRRKARQIDELPVYSDKRFSSSSIHSHHRRITARPSQSIHIYHDKEIRVSESSRPSSPTGSVPEIRITFPEEVDGSGKRQSGRVVVVHVGDTGVGLQPVDEKLPAFQSVDLEKVGGLTEMEKETRPTRGWE
ncbi:uncharacterized protein LTR77_002873 [Saxophila tyrrhenica]|uniref:Uncharacterized protein n=1 Tax=Saxophila tyrrhenica TaxID=1690608 RepID=A0AAV9PHI2_9PEZI|nr:hypothetical protein LTR77_002873 [Saxophila tyrrhenica]